MPNPNADLRALTVARADAPAPDLRLPGRWVSRGLLPALLLGGFATLAAWASWDLVAPATPVRVTPVVVRTGVAEATGQELFKANGWVEPRPQPVAVPILADGMSYVTEVKVLPGQRVRAGDVLVILDQAKVALQVQAAEKALAKMQAAERSARAELGKAKTIRDNSAAAVDLAGAEADAEARTAEADLTRAETALAAAETNLRVEEDLQKGSIGVEARLRLARQARDGARAEVTAAQAKRDKAKAAAALRRQQAEAAKAEAEAEVARLAARAEEAAQDASAAEVALAAAKLEQERTILKAPIDGVVMELNVRVGTVGGRTASLENKHNAVTLYDPKSLQVRVEVPLNKFALVQPGQPAVVEVEDVLPGKKIPGVVLYDTHQANVARNSVPVKVALPADAPEQLRPEMLAGVRFLAAARPAGDRAAVQRIVVPRRLVLTEGDQARVWVVDGATGRAALRPVKVVGGDSETAEVSEGLNPTDKLIVTGAEGLSPGARVRVVGEER